MIKGLLILNSSYIGSRDLWWPDDPVAKGGYNVYRAFDRPENWQKLNAYVLPIHYWRDQNELRQVTYTVPADGWHEDGELGHYVIKLPDVPYQKWGDDLRRTRAVTSNSNQDVAVMFNEDGNWMRPIRVNAQDREIWLKVDRALPEVGAVSDFPVTPGLPDQSQIYTKPSGTTGPLAVTSIKVAYFKLDNFVDIFTNLTRTFYTVVPVDFDGHEMHEPGALGTEYVDSYQVDKMDYMQAEMVRRNQWLFEQTGEPAWLMFRRTRGQICGCATTGTGQPRTACESCFETGIVGGYYGPFAFLYIDPDTAVSHEIEEGGIKVKRDSRSYLGPTPIIQDGDLVIRRNGERLVISGPTYKMPRGVILQQEFTTTLLPPGDTRYLIPVYQDSTPPDIYDPAKTPGYLDPRTGVFTPAPGEPPEGANPVRQINDKNPGQDRQTGATITFGNVQG